MLTVDAAAAEKPTVDEVIDYRALLVSVLKYHPIAARGEIHTDAEWAELQRLAEEAGR